MKLYYFPIAPNPTRVRLFLAEKAAAGAPLSVEPVLVDLIRQEQRSPEHLRRHPAGALPVLELDDGRFLTESLAIIELLEELHPSPPLVGATPVERAQIRELERIAELGVLLPTAGVVHATRSPLGRPPNPEVAAFYRELRPRALGRLDALLADGRPFLAGERPSIADCTLAAALQFGRFGQVPLEPEYRQLARWDAAYRERPPAKEVLVA